MDGRFLSWKEGLVKCELQLVCSQQWLSAHQLRDVIQSLRNSCCHLVLDQGNDRISSVIMCRALVGKAM